MEKTITFENNIKSYEEYKLNDSLITIIGETHTTDGESNMSEYINNILKHQENTLVLLELDSKSVKDKVYMNGIKSSTIKDVVNNVNNDYLIYFDNRNELLGKKAHYELYYGDIKTFDFELYIQKYQDYLVSGNMKDKYGILEETISQYNDIRSSPTKGKSTFENRKIQKRINTLRFNLREYIKKCWADIVDENLINMIVTSSKQSNGCNFIIIIGENHAYNLSKWFRDNTISVKTNAVKLPNNQIQVGLNNL